MCLSQQVSGVCWLSASLSKVRFSGASKQDFRSIGSFVLGALLCCLLSNGKETNITQVAGADRAEKIQLYAYML